MGRIADTFAQQGIQNLFNQRQRQQQTQGTIEALRALGQSQPQFEGLINMAPQLGQILNNPPTAQFGQAILAQTFPQPQKPTSLMQNAEAIQLLRRLGRNAEADLIEQSLLKPEVQINQGTQKPLLESSKNWRNEANQTPSPMDTPEVAYVKGFRPKTPEEIKTSESTQGAVSTIGKLFTYAFGEKPNQSLFPPDKMSPADRLIGVGKAKYHDITKSDKNVVLYNSQKKAFLSSLARIKGQSGTLTDTDLALVDDLFPIAGLTPYSIAQEQFRIMANEIMARGISKQQLLDAGFPKWAFDVPVPPGHRKVK